MNDAGATKRPPFFDLRSGAILRVRRLILSIGLAYLAGGSQAVTAQTEKSKTSSHVKVHASADKPAADGRQAITITCEIDQAHLLIGNKVPKDLESSRFSVRFTIDGKPVEAEVVYSPGTVKKDNVIGDHTLYQGRIMTTGIIRRAANDSSPVEVTIRMHGFSRQHDY